MRIRLFLLSITFLPVLLSPVGADDRPPPPKSAPPLPPPERGLVGTTNMRTTCTIGVAGGCIGAMIGTKINKTLQVAVAMAAGSFVIASVLREEIARLLIALMDLVLHRKASNITKEKKKSMPVPPRTMQEESWWPKLNTLGQTESRSGSATPRSKVYLPMLPSIKKENSERWTDKKADIIVEDVDPPTPVRQKKKRNILFWRKGKREEAPSEKPTLPPWSQVNVNQKNYVEDYGT